MDQIRGALTEVERVAEELLTAKSQNVEFDRARNKNREALTALKKLESTKRKNRGSFDGFLLRPSQVFMKFPAAQAKDVLTKDQAKVEEEMTLLRYKIKNLTRDLDDKGGVPEVCGPGLLHAFLNLKDDK
mmetsp:Transcript_29859/g.41301  ORF Transcript_29859/g.41301 Transcript_29859/m.41301 type:complete len:130 (-) Transcript_29859:128-517(-)|eukprot:CAMPEP_0196601298 /NCGR_PEP_ID=MMETSP1081-20130531/95839_1 /TAXON_ID=36882 /ORGANISM="Pyramimonas amylifera, Strain CCMP720" /LENGTH=129 /DNA_ID=CAMNT_0041927171 /DNA_START=586 /DNA_END=975 /DNA_ORIENTATION=-